MSAVALLDALEAHLGAASLVPAPLLIGVMEPAETELPAVVLSLVELAVPASGLGARSDLIEGGALAVTSRVDLADPVLATDPEVDLLSPDRRTLTLPHGGLVDSEGTDTPLGADDLQVDVDASPFTVAAAPPGTGEVSVTPAIGELELGDPLPATGTLTASYFVGQWERRVARLLGVVETRVVAGAAADARDLSNAVIRALEDATGQVGGLRLLALAAAGSCAVEFPSSTRWARSLRWHFEFEHVIDQPESSGGIIQRIRLRSRPDDAPFEEEDIE